MPNDNLRLIRDQIAVGDDVLVTGHGHGPPRQARVVEVMRGAARVVYADTRSQSAHAVLFRQLCRVEAVEPPAPVAPSKRASTPPPAPPPAAAPPVEPPAAEPSAPSDDLQTWLDMGRDLVARVDADIVELVAREAELRAVARELVDEADAAARQAVAMTRRLEQLKSLTS